MAKTTELGIRERRIETQANAGVLLSLTTSQAESHSLYVDGIRARRSQRCATSIVPLIERYLKGRKQYVALNELISKLSDVLSGIPQGSVLARILFLIFINDTNFSVDSSITTRLFADDCVMYTAVNNLEDQIILNESLTSTQAWCKKLGMRLNKTKTFRIPFTNKKKPFKFPI